MEEARSLYEQGSQAAEEQRWSDAIDLFELSYATSGAPVALFSLGYTLRAVGRFRDARDVFDQLLSGENVDSELVAQATELRAEVAPKVAILALAGLDSYGAPAIELDGAAAEDSGERPLSLEINPGDHHVRVEADDQEGRAQLARYAARSPVALSRMTYDAQEGVVRIVSDKTDGPTAGTHSFEALEFLAQLLAHVPRKSEIYVRYYGAYSVRRRADWRKSGIQTRREPLDAEEPPEPVPERVRARRRRWAELLRKIWHVDVETCPTCGGPMTILAFTMDPAAIDSTLRRIREKGNDPRAGPWAQRAPPR